MFLVNYLFLRNNAGYFFFEGDDFMPELPEVETVKETLKRQVLNKKIIGVDLFYDALISYPDVHVFKDNIINQRINDIGRRGKWLIFYLDDFCLLSHLRMEGKYFIRKMGEVIPNHSHISFKLDDNSCLIYNDVRKFGRMILVEKSELLDTRVMSELGLEPWDTNLDSDYLYNKFFSRNLPIKTLLLDQGIIAGIGNIYADEILFMSHINPLEKSINLSSDDLNNIIINTRDVLNRAIKKGGTTIKSYTSSEGVHGRFQSELFVHGKQVCKVCNDSVTKIRVGGRGTYYCSNCQKLKSESSKQLDLF